MAGHHPEQTYVAYLPEPIFRSSISTDCHLHSLARQSTAWSVEDYHLKIQTQHEFVVRDDGDVEMGGDVIEAADESPLVRSGQDDTTIIIKDSSDDCCVDTNDIGYGEHQLLSRLTQSAAGQAEQQQQHHVHDQLGRGAHHHTALASSRLHDASSRQIRSQMWHHRLHRHAGDEALNRQALAHLASREVGPATRIADDMQMVIRSERAISVRADTIVRPGSDADQMTFDALVADSEDIDEDVLVVNHPCRFYDVVNFLGRWFVAFVEGRKTCPHINSRAYSRVQELDQTRSIFRRQSTGDHDSQDIPWDDFGTTRLDALQARRSLYPTTPGNQARSHARYEDSSDQRYYRFRSFHARHRARFAHYQLRNVLTATSRNRICYAAESTVSVASLAAPDRQSTALDLSKSVTTGLPFRITTLSSSSTTSREYHTDEILFAGGFGGEYAMLNLNDFDPSSLTQGFVSHDYNGLVTHISTHKQRRSGLLQAVFSSNDCSVRVMDVSTQHFVSRFTYSVSINATTTSPDGRLRLIVGDSCEPLIAEAESGTPIATLSSHTGHGFACAWSQDGRYAATGAQDGTVQIWDSRYWKAPMVSVLSEISCVRSLHFTDDNILVMPENDDVVSFWDVRKSARQNVQFFGSIAGVAVLDGGAEIVVANADRTVGGLLVYERDRRVDHGCEPLYFDQEERPSWNRHAASNVVLSDTIQDLIL